MRRTGKDCKHIRAVKEFAAGTVKAFDDITGFVKEQVFVDLADIVKKFGEEPVNKLIQHGELKEEHDKVRLL